MDAARPAGAGAAKAPFRVLANLFGIAFGLAGLAHAWSTAAASADVPAWPGDALWVLTALVWLVTVIAYVRDVVAGGRLRADLGDPIYGPYVSLVVIVPMMLGPALARHERGAGEAVFLAGLVATVLIGGWLIGDWIFVEARLEQLHPGYLLPTVAGAQIAAAGGAMLGHHRLAFCLFGLGMVCWVVLGSITWLRLFTQPALPPSLLPTMAIEVAPPAVTSDAWFVINGGRPDPIALMLAGYMLLMVLVQVRLAPAFLRSPFGPGTWAFAFAYASVFAVAIRWVAAVDAAHSDIWTYALLAVITLVIGALSVRTVAGLARGTFLPRFDCRRPSAPPTDRSSG